jgi:hypothetical protein
MIVAAAVAVASAYMAHDPHADAYAHATDSIGLLAGLAGVVAAVTAIAADAAVV